MWLSRVSVCCLLRTALTSGSIVAAIPIPFTVWGCSDLFRELSPTTISSCPFPSFINNTYFRYEENLIMIPKANMFLFGFECQIWIFQYLIATMCYNYTKSRVRPNPKQRGKGCRNPTFFIYITQNWSGVESSKVKFRTREKSSVNAYFHHLQYSKPKHYLRDVNISKRDSILMAPYAI